MVAVRRKRPPQRQTSQAVGISAPTKGIIANSLHAGGEGGEIGVEGAIWLNNFIAGEYGARVRTGTKEFATNIPDNDSINGAVRTIMYYNSVIAGGGSDFMFAATSSGIYDITAGGAGAHTLAHAWPVKGGAAGWISYVNYTNVGGDHFLLVCDEANGYYIFDGTTWTLANFTGNPKPLAEDLVQVCEWQGRIWFVERGTSTAWFLDPLSLTGDITPMDVGNRFMKGGHLVQNTTWTIDDGDGMNDRFVQVSSSGDVLVWEGINPTKAADLHLIGRWFVGAVPEGRRVMSDWGGDVVVLASRGIVKLSELVQNSSVYTSEAELTSNITRYIRAEMGKSLDEYGWSIEIAPAENIAIVSVPRIATELNKAPIQFVVNINTGGWSMFKHLDIVCMDKSVSGFFFGTSDGRVMRLEGATDNASLDGSTSEAIKFNLLTHYSDFGSAGNWKRPQFLRPSWVGGAQPSYLAKVQFDFDLTEYNEVPPYSTADETVFDAAIWGTDTWEGTAQQYFETIGATGIGRHIAIAISGQTTSELSYVGCELIMEGGGIL